MQTFSHKIFYVRFSMKNTLQYSTRGNFMDKYAGHKQT